MSNQPDQSVKPPQPSAPTNGVGSAAASSVRLLHLTDTHLFADSDGRLLGQSTRGTFEAVLGLALSSFWPPDRILLTGDLVHDESSEGYRFLSNRLAALGVPCSCLPGNHDDPGPMREMLGACALDRASSLSCGSWTLVLLDSSVAGRDGGHLAGSELGRLEQALAARPYRPALVCLHHQPVPIGSAWMDTMALDNGEEFFAVIDRHPQVRGVIWGHVHQDFASRRKDVLLLASPSTCIQFLPGSQDFAIDAQTPGFRWLELHEDGRIDTGIRRLDAYPNPIDLGNGGY